MKNENKFFIYDNPRKQSLKSIIEVLLSFLAKLLLIICPKKRKNNPKYNVAICAIFKNEAKYLREWIVFHKLIGVNHFYMYNNNSTDNYKEVLDEFVKEGTVEIIQWEKNQAQMEAYEDCIKNYSVNAKWLGFIDIDEFVVPKTTNNIYDFLKGFEKNTPAVKIYWKIFGTSGKTERDTNGLVSEDFTKCWNKYVNIGKCFYNTKYKFDFDLKRNSALHHVLRTKVLGLSMPPCNIYNRVCVGNRNSVKSKDFPVQINHYFTKSYSEYLEKMSKGDVYFKLNPHDEAYFYEHESKCISADYSIYKYLIQLKKLLRK